MNTPTPSKPHQQEMTPGSFADRLAASYSPAPQRGIASPAFLSKKSPANAALHHHHTGSSNPGLLNFDSPSAAAALGLNLSIPGLDNSASGNVRGDEEERKRRLEVMLATLKKRPGRVEFKSNDVQRVSLSFSETKGPTVSLAPAAARILQKDLTPPPGVSPINSSLSLFSDNLERLVKLDKLSVLPGLNCFEATSGIYTSLQRIFEYEKRKSREARIENGYMDGDNGGEEAIEREVMCKKSGRPRMHAGRRVGLRLDYWMERRHVHSGIPKSAPSAATDTSTAGTEAADGSADDEPQIWSMIIECEPSPAELYPSIRVSENWVSEKVEKPHNQDDLFGTSTESAVEWLDPGPIYLPQDDNTDMVNAPESLGKLPDVRFVARLEPPVVLPLDAAVSIYGAVGAAIPEHSIMPTTYDGLLLPTEPSEGQRPFGEPRELSRERTLYVRAENGDMVERRHEYNLHVEKRAFGRLLEEIPFSHPRQLIGILPILRQHAVAASILHSTLYDGDITQGLTHSQPQQPPAPPPLPKPSNEEAFDNILADPNVTTATAEATITLLPIDIRLASHPNPRITFIFPHRGGTALATATIDIFPNGELHVPALDLQAETSSSPLASKGKGRRAAVVAEPGNVARALEVCEDLGILVSWVERDLSN
ncbi:hypothetical protein GP486_004755 [Trichoglossum hirsutum]|uniref:Mediator of RNA polymerase II transcription subunit 1 n=1 Tax=Trichoglossum hirsutum TaxID=265104 RepID=A0A9P8RNI9_9PEZI|nr:hypothetical protein GP486_004755 [Trichoglossum hirsutum]